MTPAQREVWELAEQGLTQRQIAQRLNKSRRTVRELYERAQRDPGVQRAMDTFGIRKDDVERIWFKDKGLTVQVGIKQQNQKQFLDQVREAFLDLPAAPEIPPPQTLDAEQMVIYPLFDVHHGLLAHAEVSGSDMNLELSKTRIIEGVTRLMSMTPNVEKAVIINGGDFTHQTDDRNVTRRSNHQLDVAGRNVITVLESIEIISTIIELALQKHLWVAYHSVPGNHDVQNWETILIALRERFRNNPRVTIDWNFHRGPHASEFSVIQYGQVGLFIHHGDKRPPKDLAMFCAAEFPEIWGQTRYRLLLTGHLHHEKVEEFAGITWMQFPAITVRDAYSAGGYRSHSRIIAVGFDQESETFRQSVRLK